MNKLSKRSKKEKELIDLMREDLKTNPIVKKYFEKYNVPIDTIDLVPIVFENIDVSAKTVDKKITLNRKLLQTNIITIESYLVHELVHLNQQLTGQMKGKNKKNYLDKDTESEAFSQQIKFKALEEGKQKAEEYTDDLLDYHGLDGEKRQEKKKELMKGVK